MASMIKTPRLTPKQRLYNSTLPIIGITGGIACGKSTVMEYLAQKGAFTLSADKLVKEVYQLSESFKYIEENFPQALKKNQSIDFKYLRQLAFNDQAIKKQLESFIYPRLPKIFNEKIIGKPEVIFYEIPLLFEKNMQDLLDLTVCIYSPKLLQIDRLIKRDQISKQLSEKIIAAQIDIEVKKNLATIVIENISTEKELFKNIDAFIL